jgi:two-component system nitrogen regulation sensor histidine kinase GlnL
MKTAPLQSRGLLDVLTTAVLWLSEEGIIQEANPAAESTLGVSRRQLVGQPVGSLRTDQRTPLTAALKDLKPEARCQWHDITVQFAQGQPVRCNLSLQRLSGAPLSGYVLELFSSQPEGLVGPPPETSVEHQRTRELLRHLAHEIRNPLGGLRGAAQLLARKGTKDTRPMVNIVLREVDRLADLVERVLGPGRAETRQRVNIHEVIEEAIALLAMEQTPGLAWERDYDPSLPDIGLYRSSFYQALLNLLRNAVQALEKQGGRIRIRTRAARQLLIGQALHRLALRIDIEDNGPGIPEHVMARLFTPLNSGRPGGMGLGLSIAQAAIEQQGGVIQCQSSASGTCFSIFLPVTSDA